MAKEAKKEVKKKEKSKKIKGKETEKKAEALTLQQEPSAGVPIDSVGKIKEEIKKQEPVKKDSSDENSKKELKEEKPKTHKKHKIHTKKRGKKYKEVLKLVDTNKNYSIEEAMDLAIKTIATKFDSSVEAHIKLGIKPEQSDQNIRTVADLPEGTGKTVKVAAIIGSDKEKEAKDAGADFYGSEDLVSKIEKGFLDFDVVIATPDMMGKIGKLGRILGTKGMMPNPKTETVTDNPGKAIKQIKRGRVQIKNDKFGIVHASFGKVSMSKDKLLSNFEALIDTVVKAKPQSSKGNYLKSAFLSTTMGPSIKLDISKIHRK